MCKDVQDACFKTWGEGSPLCDLGHTKCLALAQVEGCGCQPAVFPCAAEESQCEAGWKFQPNGGYCVPPCTVALPTMEGSTGDVTTGGAPAGTSSTGPAVVTGGGEGSSGVADFTTSGGTTSGGETGEPPTESDGPCGPANYATCEEGFCTPHILVLCL